MFKVAALLALLLLALQLAYTLAVQRYLRALATSVGPTAQMSYAGVDTFPVGRLNLRELRFRVAGLPALQLTVEHVEIRSLDRAWLAAWLTGLEPGLSRDLELRLHGIRASDELLSALRGRTGAVGLTLPFEGVACAAAGHALDDDGYAGLGWRQPRWDLSLRSRYNRLERRLEVDWRLDRVPPGLLHGDAVMTDVSAAGDHFRHARIERMNLIYRDQGTLDRRNRHCQTIAGSGRPFLERHRQQLHEWLGERGLVPDEPVWNAYGQWLETGAELELAARPARGIGLDEYTRFAPEDRLRLLGLRLRVGEHSDVPVEASSSGTLLGASYNPLPELPAEVDHGWPDEADGWEPIDDAIPAPNDTATGQDEGSESPVAAAAAAPERIYEPVAFAELIDRFGERVRVTTLGGNRHNGVVLDITDDALELQIARYGGGARLPIPREQIVRIERIVVR